jgi:hypothetical protein
LPSTDFDPVTALRDQLRELNAIDKTIRGREYVCEGQLAQAESELNALRKLRGFTRILIDDVRAKLTKLEQER